MTQDLFDALAALPPLDPANQQTTACKICGEESSLFDIVDFNKYCSPGLYDYGFSGIAVTYYRCRTCGFAFSRFFDDWTPQNFLQFVYNSDYIKVDQAYAGVRPRGTAALMAQRLAGLSHLRILDYGSGSGIFADHLRSCGFGDVSSYDPLSSPNRPDRRYDVITCFEVLEHTTSPLTTIRDIASLLDPLGCVFFGTGIQPENFGELRANWWYVGPRNGHASIYSLHSLFRLGQAAELVLHCGPGGTAFANAGMSSATRRLLDALGRPIRFYRLTAPGQDEAVPQEQSGCWQPLETVGSEFARFRWTCQREISWRVQMQPFEPGDLQFEIPFSTEIRPGFAAECRFTVGRHKASVVRDAGQLTMRVRIKRPTEALVTLSMPPLLRPSEFKQSADSRLLGIAIGTRSTRPRDSAAAVGRIAGSPMRFAGRPAR